MVQSQATASLKTRDLMSADLSVAISMIARFERRLGTGFNLFGCEIMGTRGSKPKKTRWIAPDIPCYISHKRPSDAVGRLLKREADADMLESCMLRDSIGRLCS